MLPKVNQPIIPTERLSSGTKTQRRCRYARGVMNLDFGVFSQRIEELRNNQHIPLAERQVIALTAPDKVLLGDLEKNSSAMRRISETSLDPVWLDVVMMDEMFMQFDHDLQYILRV